MHTSKKKIAWRTAAVAAALVSASAAHADSRYGHDGYRNHGDEHRRVWRDHDRGFERHYESRHYWYPEHRYYRERGPYWHRYGYWPSYYDDYRPRDYGAQIYFDFPLP